jgi:hypothetical protein
MGFGRGMAGAPGPGPQAGAGAAASGQAGPQDELSYLKNQADMLARQLSEIQQRIQELEGNE